MWARRGHRRAAAARVSGALNQNGVFDLRQYVSITYGIYGQAALPARDPECVSELGNTVESSGYLKMDGTSAIQ